jgi:hypothetical protein
MPDLSLKSLEQSGTTEANSGSQYAQRRIDFNWRSVTKSLDVARRIWRETVAAVARMVLFSDDKPDRSLQLSSSGLIRL